MINDILAVGPDVYIQLLSLIVYFAAIAYGILAAFDIRKSHHSLTLRYLASGLVLLSSATAIIFIIAQVPWIVEQQWRVMSFAETLAWLMYDWLNGLTHLAIVLAVRAFMRWEQITPCLHGGVCPSAILIRRDLEHDSKLSRLALDIDKLQRRIELLDLEEDDGR
jgi:hypothetical protein